MTVGRKEIIVPITVEFEDIDSYGIAHHTKLVSFLERARLRFLVALGVDVHAKNVVPVLYDLQMRFRKPVRILDELDVAVYIKNYDEYRLTLGYEIRRGKELVARATTSIAFSNLNEQHIAPAPKHFLDAMASFLA
ncbi:MAG: thioesterase family protein [Pseudomonadota bacterium]